METFGIHEISIYIDVSIYEEKGGLSSEEQGWKVKLQVKGK